jgi:hypothetical protein
MAAESGTLSRARSDRPTTADHRTERRRAGEAQDALAGVEAEPDPDEEEPDDDEPDDEPDDEDEDDESLEPEEDEEVEPESDFFSVFSDFSEEPEPPDTPEPARLSVR